MLIMDNSTAMFLMMSLIILVYIQLDTFSLVSHDDVIIIDSDWLVCVAGPSGDAQPLSIPTQFVATPTSRTIVMGDAVEFNCFTTGK